MKSFKEDASFKTGAIAIPELAVSVTLPEDNYYKQEFSRDARFSMRLKIHEYGGFFPEGLRWRHGYFNFLPQVFLSDDQRIRVEKGYFVFIYSGLDDLNRTLVIGHENGHFLESIDSKQKIYDLIGSRDLGYEREDFADLCGYLALHLNGFDLSTLKMESSDQDRNDEERTNRVRLNLIKIIKYNENRKRKLSLFQRCFSH